jgi:hypothetical protein
LLYELNREPRRSPMKPRLLLVYALVLVVGMAGVVMAADTTVTGAVMCAKCTLKKADAKECQDVLVVKDAKGATKEYYVAKNDVSEKFGHVCTGEKPATVTGAVSEKNGKTWITATKMEETKK